MTLIVHIVFVGIWLGCVLTEALFERALLGKERSNELILAKLHRNVDLFIEMPAFVIVFATGLLLLKDASQTVTLWLKVVVALLAMLANVYCVYLVFARLNAGLSDNWSRFDQIDHRQHRVGAIVLVGILAALGLGLRLG
jgi:hypothetical protein